MQSSTWNNQKLSLIVLVVPDCDIYSLLELKTFAKLVIYLKLKPEIL